MLGAVGLFDAPDQIVDSARVIAVGFGFLILADLIGITRRARRPERVTERYRP
jgi:hypothetical protein